MKKLIVVLALLVFLSGCEESYKSKESDEFYAIKENPKDMVEFLDAVKGYAATFDDSLIMGSIQLIYDDAYDLVIEFTFTRKISKNKSLSLFLDYDYQKKGIQHSKYNIGTPKVYAPFDKELDTSKWGINFEQGLLKLKEELRKKDISSFERIGCYCYEERWEYSVFITDDYEDRIEITIPTS